MLLYLSIILFYKEKTMNNDKKRIILTTGGTGGHIFPAITTSNLLKEAGYSVMIVGDKQLEKYADSIECEYKIVETGKTKSIKTVISLIKGFFQNVAIIKKFKPDLVIGFGSYATFSTLLASKFLKIPFFLHESNSTIGKVNKWMSNFANCIMTNFHELYGINIKNTNKIKIVGMPIRENIAKLANKEYKYPDFSKNEKFNIFITCGSGGATFFGTPLIEAIKLLDSKIKKSIIMHHQVRLNDLDSVREFYKNENIEAEVKTFFTNMDEQFKNANLVISRSGTGTISELMTVGIPTIFIPSPNVANNHQYKNTELLAKSNACVLQEEKDFNPENFAKLLTDLILNKENKLNVLRENTQKFSNINSNKNIVNCINEFFINKK